MEPRKLDIKGRQLSKEENDNLRQYFDGMDYLVDTMHIVDANIVNAKNEEAAHTWVQWLLNAALQSFDSNIESIRGEEE
tara:strand:+ start:805 stop:1041 length:237 start_codon:yes stop_codon:yes gene_type:complete